MIALTDLLTATQGHVVGPIHANSFSGFAFDSRNVQTGELFVAVKTERGDGHRYIAEAVAKGASGVLCQVPPTLLADVTVIEVAHTQTALQAWGRYILQKYGTAVIGVTGSTGKTTTKELIAHLLASQYNTFKNQGNWNGRYGLPLALGQLTPEHQVAVLEMASDARGEIADLVVLAPPQVAVVTTVQPAHLEVFGDLETVAREKSDIVRTLPPAGVAFLNADDARVAAMAQATQARVVTYGQAEGADLRASAIKVTLEGTHFNLHTPNAALTPLFVPLLGSHIIYPTLAAIGVALHYGVELTTIVARLASVARIPGWLNLLTGVNGSLILDDSYNASPAAVLAALETLAQLPARRRVALLGDMHELGDYTTTGHTQVGQKAAQVVEQLVTKGEQARIIAQSAEQAGLSDSQIAITYTDDDAVRAVRQQLGTGDIVLVKGGGEARMERLSAALLNDPQDRRHLVRQSGGHGKLTTRPAERPTWLEIDLNAIAHNTTRVKAIVGPEVAVMAIMKADGYGHGAIKTAQTALLNGATWLGVAALPEAQALRVAGIDAPLLILGYTPPWQSRAVLRLGLRVTVFSLEVAHALADAAAALETTAQVHIKVDTGMHRLGIQPEEAVEFIQAVRALPGLEVEGIFTHFSVADGGDDFSVAYTHAQIAQFDGVLDRLKEANVATPIIHAANSAATFGYPQARYNMVRPGIALYGLAPSPDVPLPDFRPALSWKTQVAQVRTLPPDSYISYGATYRTAQSETIATIPVGYADGFRRAPQNWGEVLVRGQRAPLVGRVCMDQTMINVSHIPDVQAGDEVVLIGRQGEDAITAEEIGARLGTIPYEVVSAILARVPRLD